MRSSSPALTIALVGPPNTGKSTIFNRLTHQAQYTGNWHGKTFEQKAGLYRHDGICIQVVDLPGAYSLTAAAAEERLTRDYLLQNQPEVAAVIVDAASLERNLYLVAELLLLQVPLVIGLNMVDLAGQQGMQVDPHALQTALGLPVVELTAHKGQGIHELISRAVEVARSPVPQSPSLPEISPDHRQVLAQVAALISGKVPAPYPESWAAVKLLEGDEDVTRMMRGCLGELWVDLHKVLLQHDDAFLAVASGRYEWIGTIVKSSVVRPKAGQVSITDRIDRYATHPVLGILVLLAILGGLFWLTYTAGAPLQTWLEVNVVQAGAGWLRNALVGLPPWLAGLLVDGVIAGVGTVLTLLPILVIFFTVFGALEDTGYMSRAAYVMDRFMHLMGLHGKSFLPVFLGFGCNVPAIMGTRIVDSPKARLITILVTPLVPCTARLSVLALLAPIFFGSAALWVTLGLLSLSMLVLILLGILLHEFFLGGEHTSFIMELPLYHAPDPASILKGVWGRVVDFLKGAGTVILVVSVLMWVLSAFPGSDIQSSYLAAAGRFLSPLGAWMGLDWQMMVALLASFVRKENTVTTLAVLYGSGQAGIGLAGALSGVLTPAAALAFLAVQMLFVPCIATVGAIKQESRSWTWTFLSIGLLIVVSMLVGTAIYQAARLLAVGV